MRIPRTTATIFFAILFAGTALFILLPGVYTLGDEVGFCAGFFGLLALWMFADYRATKRREHKRLTEFTRRMYGEPIGVSWNKLGVAQSDSTIQRSHVEDAELTRRYMQDRADIEGMLRVAQSDPTEQLSLVEIAEQVHQLAKTYRLAAEDEALGDPAKIAEIRKQIQEERSRLMRW